MPKSGRRWFQLREDYRVEAELCNDQLFESLISRMIAKDELERPSANQIASWGPFKTEVSRRKESLIQMLEAERSKNEELEKEIEKLNQSALSHMSNSWFLSNDTVAPSRDQMRWALSVSQLNMFFLQRLLVFKNPASPVGHRKLNNSASTIPQFIFVQ